MKIKPKYSEFALFLKAKREDKYRSARDFCSRVKLQVSYPQYSRYEAGDQLPSLSQALAMGDALATPTLEMLLEWNRAQVDEPVSRAQVDGLLEVIRSGSVSKPQPELPKSAPVPLDEVIVFNRSHRELFMKDPGYRDIFTYVNAFTHPKSSSTTLDAISNSLKIPAQKLALMLENLIQLGVILEEGGQYRAAKRNFYFPDDQDFFELRHGNLRHNLDRVLQSIRYEDLAQKRAYRSLVTRELTEPQLGWVMGQLETLLGKVVDLPEDPSAKTIYSVCAVLGERFSRS